MVRLYRYTKVNFPFNYTGSSFTPVATVLLLFIMACTGEMLQNHTQASRSTTHLANNPMVVGQKNPPSQFKSLQLYRNNNKTSIPAVQLGSRDYITLKFDELGNAGRMFRVRVRHRNADWFASSIMEGFYLKGYREDLITGGEPSSVQEPFYTHYTYQFPNENMQVKISGNYLLDVFDYETSRLLFSLPFFVYEDAGNIGFSAEKLYGMDSRYLLHHQPFAYYYYPSYIIDPVVDLRVFFVQNRFWGRAIESDEHDMSESGVYRSYMERRRSFVGVYEYRPLDLRHYDASTPEILEVRPETIPPRVTLFRDVVNLDVNPDRRSPSPYGIPRDDHRARYIDVHFELEIPTSEDAGSPVYVYGPFNNWTINRSNRLNYQEETASYTGNAVIKEGEYDYKYAVLDNGRVDDLRLDASFASNRQEYTTLVYYRDPEWQADRLLQLQSIQIE